MYRDGRTSDEMEELEHYVLALGKYTIFTPVLSSRRLESRAASDRQRQSVPDHYSAHSDEESMVLEVDDNTLRKYARALSCRRCSGRQHDMRVEEVESDNGTKRRGGNP
ncbi:hypothetical protein R3P38DRAFT_2771587 [Favolaschia claudopus]|uniref:Uncharacterized protein n=1 Tax=Favolaschia claudopus TaxID=2862362 RepID=A0AAW0C9W9_9AGAR